MFKKIFNKKEKENSDNKNVLIAGGAGSAVNEKLLELNSSSKVLNLGLPDGFIEHGDQEQQKIMNNLDSTGVRKAIEQKLKSI